MDKLKRKEFVCKLANAVTAIVILLLETTGFKSMNIQLC